MLAALAVGLGNFGASVSIGLSGATMATRMKVGTVFVIFEAGMPLVGLLAGQRAARALGYVSGYAGGALLITIGAWVLIQAFPGRQSGAGPPRHEGAPAAHGIRAVDGQPGARLQPRRPAHISGGRRRSVCCGDRGP